MAYKYVVYRRFILAAHVFVSKHDGNIPELGLGNTGACRTQVPCGEGWCELHIEQRTRRLMRMRARNSSIFSLQWFVLY